jgi:hypothetical protein
LSAEILNAKGLAVTTHLDRRQSLVFGLTAATVAVMPLLAPNTAPAFPIRIAKGRPVPPWLERSSHPGFFGVDVEIVEGGVELFRAPPEMEPSYAASYRAFRIAPVSPMRPGDCLIRYKGCRDALRVHGVGQSVIYDGGPDAVGWTEDGDDLLLMAAADAADRNALPSTLADDPPAADA